MLVWTKHVSQQVELCLYTSALIFLPSRVSWMFSRSYMDACLLNCFHCVLLFVILRCTYNTFTFLDGAFSVARMFSVFHFFISFSQDKVFILDYILMISSHK